MYSQDFILDFSSVVHLSLHSFSQDAKKNRIMAVKPAGQRPPAIEITEQSLHV